MTSDNQPQGSAQQPFTNTQPSAAPHNLQATSPPTKQSLKTWWKGFSKQPPKIQEQNGKELFSTPFTWFPVAAPFRYEHNYYTGSLVLTLHSNTQGMFKENPMDCATPILDGASGEEEVSHHIPSSSRCVASPLLVTASLTSEKSPDSVTRRRLPGDIPGLDHGLERSSRGKQTTVLVDQSSTIFLEQIGEVVARAPGCEISSEQSVQAPVTKTRQASFSNTIKRVKNALKINAKANAKKTTAAPPLTGIFGVPLRQSITYANVAISLVDSEGQSYIYGYVPIVVAKCGVYLKEKATNVEGIFRLSGSEKRIKELRIIFDSPDRYGKGLDWAGYTVHDAANVLRRYLNQLPEPIVPLDLYDRFRQPLRGFTKQAVGDADGPQLSEDFDASRAIVTYQQLITELPPLNRQLLLYILDLLAVFASKSDENRMTSANLSAIFQPGMLSHPDHDMKPEEYRLSQDVLIFLIENQDHFLIGMRGTAADEQTVAEVQNGGTPPPGTPNTQAKRTTVARTASNASAGADSVRKFGGVRRNVSVSSRHSRQSNGAPSPASPAYGPPLTHSPASAGVHRSNTVPAKRSPGLPSNRLHKNSGSPSPTAAAGFMSHQLSAPRGLSPATGGNNRSVSPSTSGAAPAALGNPNLAPPTQAASIVSQERLTGDQSTAPTTPRNISNLFQRSPTSDTEKKQPNKLRKKRVPASSNPSAQSSTHSLQSQDPLSPVLHPTRLATEIAPHPPLESIPSANPILSSTQATPPATEPPQADLSGHHFPIRPDELHQTSDKTLKPTSPAGSLRSRSSFNDQSDPEHQEDSAAVAEQREKRSRWRISRHHRDSSQFGNSLSPKKVTASENGAGASSSSLGSASRPGKSFTGDSNPVTPDGALIGPHPHSSHEGSAGSEEKKGPLGWIKKMREKLEENKEKEAEKEHIKTSSASIDRLAPPFPTSGKGTDFKRPENPERLAEEPATQQALQHPQR
ncbi:RhoGAP domain-containing protein [Diplocarpon rosae]|nr:RhoGAP domain-containing protein [Diplocarpon rosae]